MLTLLKKNNSFLIILLLFIITTGYIVISYDKVEAHLIANKYHNTFFDYFFYVATKIVEVVIGPIILLLILFFKNFKYGFITIMSFGASGVTAQLLKKTIYNDVMRPTAVIDNLRLLPESFDFHNTMSNSFPSGHTTVSFSLFCMLTLIVANKKWGYVFGLIAAAVGFSRVYLSQHFFEDILAGALIGTTISFVTFFIFDRYSFGILSKYSLRGKIDDKK